MADGRIVTYAGTGGPAVDTSELTVAGNVVERQRIVLASDSAPAGLVGVTTRGVQGAYALAVQPLSEAGRTIFSLNNTPASAAVVADTLMTLTPARDGVAAAAATSFGVTTGKALRLTGGFATVRASAAVASWSRFTLRINPTGAAVATSPVLIQIEVGTPAQVIGATATAPFEIPDGIDFTGTMQFGISRASAATTVLETFSLFGYEF